MKKLLVLFVSFGLVSVLFADDTITLDSNSSNEQIEQEHNKTEIEMLDEECKKYVIGLYYFIPLAEKSNSEIEKMYQDCVDKKHKGIERKEKKRGEEQERIRKIEEYNKQKEQEEQARLNSVNNLNVSTQTDINSSSEIKNIDTNNSGE